MARHRKKQFEVLPGVIDAEVEVTLDLARVCFNAVRKLWYLSVVTERVEKIMTRCLCRY